MTVFFIVFIKLFTKWTNSAKYTWPYNFTLLVFLAADC